MNEKRKPGRPRNPLKKERRHVYLTVELIELIMMHTENFSALVEEALRAHLKEKQWSQGI